jgi:DNA polymerase delta subunit 1
MVRSWSLVLRTALRCGLIAGGREDPLPLSESPFLQHPLEHGGAAA